MPTLVLQSLHSLKDYVGREIATTGWLPVTQERIRQFAEATEDRQWIHVDPERARRESPYGAAIAHGFQPRFCPARNRIVCIAFGAIGRGYA